MTDNNNSKRAARGETPICSVDGCDRVFAAKKMCRFHYSRTRSTGSIHGREKQTAEERFMSFIRVEEKTGAWLWTGGVTSAGYGGFWVNGRTIGAHRFSYELKYGPIPDGMCVCHKYEDMGRHNVNPDHLFLGSYFDNMRDASVKGRLLNGEKNSQSVLTEEMVVDIRASCDSNISMAGKHGVSGATISKIRRGSAWMRADTAPTCETKIHSMRNKTGYRGVCRKKGAFEAAIVVTKPDSKKTFYLGRFDNPVDAAKAFDAAALKHRGESAKLNFPINTSHPKDCPQ